MSTMPSLPVELWDLILDFAALLNDSAVLFAFYEVNYCFRSLLKDPDHKHWTEAFAKSPKPAIKRSRRTYSKLEREYGARSCLRFVRFKMCMACNTTKNVTFYLNIFKHLCSCCFYEHTISQYAAQTFFTGKLGAIDIQNAFPLPGFERKFTGMQVIGHIWRSKFLAFRRGKRNFPKGVETFEEYEERKMRVIEEMRGKQV